MTQPVPQWKDVPDYSESWCDNSKPVEPEVIVVQADVDE